MEVRDSIKHNKIHIMGVLEERKKGRKEGREYIRRINS